MNPILLNRQIRFISFQLDHLQQPRRALGKSAAQIRAEHFIDFPADALLVVDASLGSKKTAADTLHRMRFQKILAEQHLVDLLAVKPERQLI